MCMNQINNNSVRITGKRTRNNAFGSPGKRSGPVRLLPQQIYLKI